MAVLSHSCSPSRTLALPSRSLTRMLRALPFVLAWKPLPEVLWQDSRDHFHILSHVRTNSSGAGGSKVPISGHLFSEDGLDWRFSPTEPYTNTIRYTDGTSRLFATLERPKLALDPVSGHPTFLFNGVSSHWPCLGSCCGMKTRRGSDWTWTMVRPLG